MIPKYSGRFEWVQNFACPLYAIQKKYFCMSEKLLCFWIRHMDEHPKFTAIGKKRNKINKYLALGKERFNNRFSLASGTRKCFYGNWIAIQTAKYEIGGLLRREFCW
jgi:hypothetical protein